jgi:cytochrome c5
MHVSQTKPSRSTRRNDRRLALFALSAFGLLGAACFPKAGPAPGVVSADRVTWASTKWPGVTAASLTAGHDKFIAKCNGCHGYPDLGATSEGEWPSIVDRMAKKAGLAPAERDDVLHYVLAARPAGAGR